MQVASYVARYGTEMRTDDYHYINSSSHIVPSS